MKKRIKDECKNFDPKKKDNFPPFLMPLSQQTTKTVYSNT
jgi:hypothetical protein